MLLFKSANTNSAKYIGTMQYAIHIFSGGFDDSSPLNTCERYDPQTNKWEKMPDMTCGRGGVGVSTMAGQVFAVGGHDGHNYLCSVEAYDPITNRFDIIHI